MIGMLGDHLWQSTLFAAVAGLLTLALRKNRAHVRYWLWFAASLKFLAPFAALVAIGSQFSWRSAVVEPVVSTFFMLDAVSQPFSQPALRPAAESPATVFDGLVHALPAFLAALWLCGGIAVLATWMIRWRRVAAAARAASCVQDSRELNILRRLEHVLRIRRPMSIVSSDTSLEPGVFGILKPVLLWPRTIGARLSDEQVEAILAHELAHVRRRDNLTAALQMFVQAAFWFHPLVWWLGARLVDERERACDEDVVRLGYEPQLYAESILKTCEFYVESPLVCVAGVTGSDLKKRIEAIMTNHAGAAVSGWKKLVLATAAMMAVGGPVVVGVLNAPRLQAQSGAADAKRRIDEVRELFEQDLAAADRQREEADTQRQALEQAVTDLRERGGRPPEQADTSRQRDQMIADLRERVGQLRQQASTQRQLEQMIADLRERVGQLREQGDTQRQLEQLLEQIRDLRPRLGQVREQADMSRQLDQVIAGYEQAIANYRERFGQQREQSPAFEVASVKPNKSGDQGMTTNLAAGGRLSGINVTVRRLVELAYSPLLPAQIVGGPGWINSDRFDIEAKAATDLPSLPPGSGLLMMRSLLADRFKLKVHNEPRELPLYGLVMARSDGRMGPQLRRSDVDCAALIAAARAGGAGLPAPSEPGGVPPCGNRTNTGRVIGRAMTMERLVAALSPLVGRAVTDRTGLSGTFDVDLEWTPDRQLSSPGGTAPSGASDGPSIFTALQEQLGLKLESTRGPVDVLVIDSVEQPTPD